MVCTGIAEARAESGDRAEKLREHTLEERVMAGRESPEVWVTEERGGE